MAEETSHLHFERCVCDEDLKESSSKEKDLVDLQEKRCVLLCSVANLTSF